MPKLWLRLIFRRLGGRGRLERLHKPIGKAPLPPIAHSDKATLHYSSGTATGFPPAALSCPAVLGKGRNVHAALGGSRSLEDLAPQQDDLLQSLLAKWYLR